MTLDLGAVVLMSTTAYGPGCGSRGITKAGTVPRAGFTVAADRALLELGTEVHVEGLGRRYVEDIGPAIQGHELDIFFDTCGEADAWARRARRVAVLRVPELQRGWAAAGATGRNPGKPTGTAGSVEGNPTGDDRGLSVPSAAPAEAEPAAAPAWAGLADVALLVLGLLAAGFVFATGQVLAWRVWAWQVWAALTEDSQL